MSERRFPDVFVDPEDDPREEDEAPPRDDERAVLMSYLRWQRGTLELKCSGLTADQLARRSVEPSTMSLLGLVRHMAEVERRWFQVRLAGLDAPFIYVSDSADPAFDDAVGDPEMVAAAWDNWRVACAFSDEYVAAAPDLLVTGHVEHQGEMSLREILIHMVEEYARHNGHADFLRERIDGRTGQ